MNIEQAHNQNNDNSINQSACGARQTKKQVVKSKKTAKTKIDIYQTVTDQMIELLEANGADWVKSWSGNNGLPVNVSSGNAYKGINILLLGCSAHKKGFDSNMWGTFKQWKDKGGTVKKGEKGTGAVFYKTLTVKDQETDNGEDKKIPMLNRFTLFNYDQVEGVDIEQAEIKTFENDIIEAGQAILDGSKADIRHEGGKAFYLSQSDYIQLPKLERFHTATDYYLTAFHELTHWTGNKSRLDRNLQNRFGDQAYAAEELIAEMGAAFLATITGLSVEPRADHAKYINSWLKVLKDDKRAIFTAASKAQAGVDFIIECNE